MTIPKGTEQWECDLIAPSAAPGLTMHDVFVTDLNAAVDAVAQHYEAACRAGGGDADDDFDAATLCFTLLHRHGVKLRALAAGQAHPQGRGEPVAWLSTVITEKGNTLQRLGLTLDEAEMANATPQPLYAAPAANQAAPILTTSELPVTPKLGVAPAAVAERRSYCGRCDDVTLIRNGRCTVCTKVVPADYPATDPAATAQPYCTCGHDGKLTSADCPIHGTAPAKAQEPDALVREMRQYLQYAKISSSAAMIEEAADRIEADAALIAELREYKAMYEGLCK